jgi:pimeloyl-ACP methyl ester carboxylesterase
MNGPTQMDRTVEVPAIATVDGVEEGCAIINGLRWRYLHAGSGPALLLVHGFMGYSFSWRFVMAELARHFSVYAVDLPGCGFSERNPSLPGTLASDAEGLLNFKDPLGIEQVDVLGTSRGVRL